MGRVEFGQVLRDCPACHGQAVALQQTGVQQGLHDDRYAADVVDVFHDEPAEGFHVCQVGDLSADALEVADGEVHFGFVGDG